jgi:hypothetical protein
MVTPLSGVILTPLGPRRTRKFKGPCSCPAILNAPPPPLCGFLTTTYASPETGSRRFLVREFSWSAPRLRSGFHCPKAGPVICVPHRAEGEMAGEQGRDLRGGTVGAGAGQPGAPLPLAVSCVEGRDNPPSRLDGRSQQLQSRIARLKSWSAGFDRVRRAAS